MKYQKFTLFLLQMEYQIWRQKQKKSERKICQIRKDKDKMRIINGKLFTFLVYLQVFFVCLYYKEIDNNVTYFKLAKYMAHTIPNIPL